MSKTKQKDNAFQAVMVKKIYTRKSCNTSPPLANYFSKLLQDSLHIWKNCLGDLNSRNMFCSKSLNIMELEGFFYSVSCHRGNNLREMFRKKNQIQTKIWGCFCIRYTEMFWTFFPKIPQAFTFL